MTKTTEKTVTNSRNYNKFQEEEYYNGYYYPKGWYGRFKDSSR